MTDNIPDWLALPLIIVLWAVAAYKCWIRPGYDRDKERKLARRNER